MTQGRPPAGRPQKLLVDRQTAIGAGSPGEAIEREIATAGTHPSRESRILQQLSEPLPKLGHVARLDQEAGDAILDDLRQAAEMARDDRRAAGHRFQHDQPEELRHLDAAAVTGQFNRGKRQYRRLTIQAGKRIVRRWPEEFDVVVAGKPTQQIWVVALGQRRVMTCGTGDTKPGTGWERLNQPIDTLVRRQPPDEQDAVSAGSRIGRVVERIGAAVNDASATRRGTQFASRVRRHQQEAIEETRQQAGPIAAWEAVIGDDRTLPPYPRRQRRESARGTSQMMGVDEVGPCQSRHQARRDRVRRMAMQESTRPEYAQPKSAAFAAATRSGAKGNQLAFHVAGERAC